MIWNDFSLDLSINLLFHLFIFSEKKSILRDRRDFWCVLELVEKFVPEAAEITATVRDMPRLKYDIKLHLLNSYNSDFIV